MLGPFIYEHSQVELHTFRGVRWWSLVVSGLLSTEENHCVKKIHKKKNQKSNCTGKQMKLLFTGKHFTGANIRYSENVTTFSGGPCHWVAAYLCHRPSPSARIKSP